MTFLYVVHVYMFCNVVLHCIALPARVLFAIKIIIFTIHVLRNTCNIISNEMVLVDTSGQLRFKHS